MPVTILKQTVHDVPEVKNEPPEERTLSYDNNWLFDLVFLVNVTDHLNHLNIKLQGKSKLFLNFMNYINAFKMKLKLFIPQLENEDEPVFVFKEHTEGVVDNGN